MLTILAAAVQRIGHRGSQKREIRRACGARVWQNSLAAQPDSKKACWHNGRVLARRCMCCRLIYTSCILTIELQRVEHAVSGTQPRRNHPLLPNLPNYSPPTSRAVAPPSRMQHADGAKYPLCKHATLAKRRCCVAPAPAGVAPTSDLIGGAAAVSLHLPGERRHG